MKNSSIVMVVCMAIMPLASAQQGLAHPFESAKWTVPMTEVDTLVLAKLKAKNITPARPCSDSVFVRRVQLHRVGQDVFLSRGGRPTRGLGGTEVSLGEVENN